MLHPDNEIQVYLYSEPVDMRKSMNGLSILIEQEVELSPTIDALFVFCNRGRDKIKLLCWERNGFIVWYKRLEKQRFRWPSAGETGLPPVLNTSNDKFIRGVQHARKDPIRFL